MLEYGANPNGIRHEISPLILAVMSEEESAVDVLIEYGASVLGDINASSGQSMSYAVEHQNQEIFDLIFAKSVVEYQNRTNVDKVPLESGTSENEIGSLLFESESLEEAALKLSRDGMYGWSLFTAFFATGAQTSGNSILDSVTNSGRPEFVSAFSEEFPELDQL